MDVHTLITITITLRVAIHGIFSLISSPSYQKKNKNITTIYILCSSPLDMAIIGHVLKT